MVSWVHASCVTMNVVFELELVWVASHAQFMPFGIVVGYVIHARPFPCHLVLKAGPSEAKIFFSFM